MLYRLISIVIFLTLSCAVTAKDKPFITVASTTSTQNSGLYEFILPKFSNHTGIDVRVVAVGTGKAIKIAENGDADVLLVHHQLSEEKFVQDGFGLSRFDLMYNDFVLVGPKDDTANVANANSVIDALQRIAHTKSIFVSRGDDSGTHKKEVELWKISGARDTQRDESWYRETGSGMGAALNIASGMNAYVLSDRATWIKFANKGQLAILFEGDKEMFNQYGVILVNPERHPHVKKEEGKQFISWLLSSQGQSAIAAYRIEGQKAFFPNR